ncbi:hypothetical protein SAMN05421724_4532 [Pseudomonas syringae]|nr:hypothetical protein SAMN05421724_4532 [Pseudomonas syringae]
MNSIVPMLRVGMPFWTLCVIPEHGCGVDL